MAHKECKTRGLTMIYRTLYRKLHNKNRGWTQVFRNGELLLLHPSCYSSYKPGDESLLVKDQIKITKNANVVQILKQCYVAPRLKTLLQKSTVAITNWLTVPKSPFFKYIISFLYHRHDLWTWPSVTRRMFYKKPGFTPLFGGFRVVHSFRVLCCIFVLFVFVPCLVFNVACVSGLSIVDCPLLIVHLTFSDAQRKRK